MSDTLRPILEKVRAASRVLASLDGRAVDAVLLTLAELLIHRQRAILNANANDLIRLGSGHPTYDRLRLTAKRIAEMAAGLRTLASLPRVVGEVLEKKTMQNKLRVTRVRVPLGVIGMVYEARPNVTVDAFGIALKAHNAIVLKGGSDAQETNAALLRCIQTALRQHGLPHHSAYLLPAGREAAAELFTARGLVDVLIPRGSASLIRAVRETATVPVIETGAGVVHLYFDAEGDVTMGERCILSSKVRRPSVCNALDTLLVHQSRVADLPALTMRLAGNGVTLHGDTGSYRVLAKNYPRELLKKATPESYGREYLGLAMSIRVVRSLAEALRHIAEHSSGHSEAIITQDTKAAEEFLRSVDAACVYHNAETGFSDGGELGLGAEIGISTQKLHARGPMGVREMTTYKWVITGTGQTRMQA